MDSLQDLFHDWTRWSRTADKSENNWESSYPKWNELMQAAKRSMINPSLSASEMRILEQCWAISEEDEELADYARNHIEECWTVLLNLCSSADPRVRWQVYAVLGHAGSKAEDILRKGVEDVDAYARRRALLGLAQILPHDFEHLARRFMQDEDPYNRQVAKGLLKPDC